jgi:tetratricopeptide (TPR) repeat protein
MVTAQSAILNWELEKTIPSNNDHSHIAKIRDDSEGIYHEIRAEIETALKSTRSTNLSKAVLTEQLNLKETKPQIQDNLPSIISPELEITSGGIGTPQPQETVGSRPSIRTPLAQEEKLKKAIQTARKTFGPNHSETLAKMQKLAIYLRDEGLNDQLIESEKLARKIYEVREKKLGMSHNDTLASLDLLGSVVLAQGKFLDAENYYRLIIERYESSQRPNSEEVLVARYQVSELLWKQYKTDDALTMCKSLLQERLEKSGPNNVKTLDCQDLLSRCLMDKEEYSEARKILEGMLKRMEEHYGVGSYEALNIIQEIGTTYKFEQEYKEAEAFFEKALKGRKALNDDADFWILQSLQSLASVLESQGKYLEAADCNRKILEGTEDDDMTEQRVTSLLDLGRVLYFGEKSETNLIEAEQVLRKAMDEVDILDDDDDSKVKLEILTYLARVLRRVEKYDEAENIATKALEVSEDASERSEVAYAFKELGYIQYCAGKFQEAVDSYLKAIQTYEKDEDAKEDASWVVKRDLADAYLKLKDYDKADSTTRELLKLREDKLGPTHDDTISTMEALINVLVTRQEHGKELNELRQELKSRKSRQGQQSKNATPCLAADKTSSTQVLGRCGIPDCDCGLSPEKIADIDIKRKLADGPSIVKRKKDEVKNKRRSVLATMSALPYSDYASDPSDDVSSSSLYPTMDYSPSVSQKTSDPLSSTTITSAVPGELSFPTTKSTSQIFADIEYTLSALGIKVSNYRPSILTSYRYVYHCSTTLVEFFHVEVKHLGSSVLFAVFSYGDSSGLSHIAERCERRLKPTLMGERVATKFDRKSLRPSDVIAATAELLNAVGVLVGSRRGPWTNCTQTCSTLSFAEITLPSLAPDMRRLKECEFDVQHEIMEDEAGIEVTFQWKSGDKVTFENIAKDVASLVQEKAFKYTL